MCNHFIKRKGPYELDAFESEDYACYVPLTKKNRDFIEGCLKLDSNYRSNLTELVKALNDENYKEQLLEIINSINKVNRTRISEKQQKVIRNKLFKEYRTVDLLKGAIANAPKELFILIGKKGTFFDEASNQEVKMSLNVSFASKFIFYMSVEFNLDTHNKYSKYDSKVSENLAKYLDIYGINPHHFNKKSFAKEKDIDLTWKMFDEKYNASLKELKKIVKKVHKYEISLGEIDHIIWYTQK